MLSNILQNLDGTSPKIEQHETATKRGTKRDWIEDRNTDSIK